MERAKTQITHLIQKARHGFSDRDVFDARRVLRGNITPEDREKHKLDAQKEILGGDHPNVLFSPVHTKVEITPELRTELQEIVKLPDDEVDIMLQEKAESDLAQWETKS